MKDKLVARVYKILVVGPITNTKDFHENIMATVEIYVPNEQLVLSIIGNKLNAFIQDEKRYGAKTTKLLATTGIDRDLVKRIIFNIEQREEIQVEVEKLLEGFNG